MTSSTAQKSEQQPTLTQDFLNAVERVLENAINSPGSGIAKKIMSDESFIQKLTEEAQRFQDNVDNEKIKFPIPNFAQSSSYIRSIFAEKTAGDGIFGQRAERRNDSVSAEAKEKIKDVAMALAIRQKPLINHDKI